LGVKVVLTRSFARIHETNLKKQGVLAVTFSNPADYDSIQEEDTFDIQGLMDFQPGKALKMIVRHKDGTSDEIMLSHSYSALQIEWFKAGSALNYVKKTLKS
jgi:aconitate hydratase